MLTKIYEVLNMEFLMTEKQKQVYWKKKRLVELKLEGLTHKQVREQLNEELRDKGLKRNFVKLCESILESIYATTKYETR